MEAILRALTQYALCIIAKDAGSRYPNPRRMLGNLSTIVQNTNDLKAGGTVQDQMGTLLASINGSSAVPQLTSAEQIAVDKVRADAAQAENRTLEDKIGKIIEVKFEEVVKAKGL